MKNLSISIRLVALLAVTLLSSACVEDVMGPSPAPAPTTDHPCPHYSRTTHDGLQITLCAEGPVFAYGESIHLQMTVENVSDEAITLQFPTGQMHDFVAKRSRTTYWQWSSGKVFTQAFLSKTLQPGEKLVRATTWDQQTNDGRQVSAGKYDLVAVVTSSPAKVGHALPIEILHP